MYLHLRDRERLLTEVLVIMSICCKPFLEALVLLVLAYCKEREKHFCSLSSLLLVLLSLRGFVGVERHRGGRGGGPPSPPSAFSFFFNRREEIMTETERERGERRRERSIYQEKRCFAWFAADVLSVDAC